MAETDLTRRIRRIEHLCPEQIVATTRAQGGAGLVDQWGRAHALAERTIIGRDLDDSDIAVLEASVSRRHAELRLEDQGWIVEDLGSTNGTFVEGEPLREPRTLRDEDLVTIGDVDFAFHQQAVAVCRAAANASLARTGASSREGESGLILLGSTENGGVVEDRGHYIQLGISMYSLVEVLAARMLAERDRGDAVRGFVSSVELLEVVPWETAHPEDNNVKQLVRRTRRAFERAGLEDPIESRRGAGYRLRYVAHIHESVRA